MAPKRSSSGGRVKSNAKADAVADTDSDDSEELLAEAVRSTPLPDLVSRRDAIKIRLNAIVVELPASDRKKKGGAKRARQVAAARSARLRAEAAEAKDAPIVILPVAPRPPRTDVHRDYVLKEMMWLGADFQSERKAHASSATRVAAAVRQFHRTKESRRVKEMAEFELRRRRLAGRMARAVVGTAAKPSSDHHAGGGSAGAAATLTGGSSKSWWGKIDRVVGHKRRVEEDGVRRRAMDRQLVFLVKQTERYGRALTRGDGSVAGGEGEEMDDGEIDDDGDDVDGVTDLTSESEGEHPRHRRRRRRQRRRQGGAEGGGGPTIEEALAAADAVTASSRSREARKLTTDYTRVRVSPSDDELYGESTADDSDDYEPESDCGAEGGGAMDDDEETLAEAEAEGPGPAAVQEELRKLREEETMEVGEVVARLEEEARAAAERDAVDGADESNRGASGKRVSFAPTFPKKDPTADDDVAAASASRGVAFKDAAATLSLPPSRHADDGGDADDDRDASDVEDFVDDVGEGGGKDGATKVEEDDDEFEAGEPMADDETTTEAEDRMGRDMSYVVLERENEMSVEELRALYAPSGADGAKENDGDEGESNDGRNDAHGFDGARDAPDVEMTTTSADAAGQPPSRRSKRRAGRADGAPKATAVGADAIGGEEEEDEGGASSGSEEFDAQEPVVDDETTMEAEERMGRDMSYEDEIALLNRENEMSVEELKALYANMQQPGADGEEPEDDDDGGDEGNGNDAKDGHDEGDTEKEDGGAGASAALAGPPSRRSSKRRGASATPGTTEIEATDADGAAAARDDADADSSGSEEFESAEPAVDDETTIEAEERLGRDMSYDDEIALLNRENEMSVEELRALYAGAGGDERDDSDDDATDTDAAGDDREREDARLDESVDSGGGGTSSLAADFDADDSAAEDEFVIKRGEEEPPDDETTLDAEERMGREMSPEDELDMLRREGDRPLEDLLEMRAAMEREAGVGAASNGGSGGGSEDVDGDGNEDGVRDSSSKRKREEVEGAGEGEDNDADCGDGGGLVDEAAGKKKPKTSGDGGGSADDGDGVLRALRASEERARSASASRPFILAPWVKMREYQRAGLSWLVSLQTRRLNGILADEMGLGKTLQTISLLAYLACYKGIWGPHLIVVPTSCIVNWELELKRFCPALKVLCYYGTAKRRKELRVGWTKSNWYHVVITSYQLAVQDAFAFKRKKWYYLILDEAQNIKNFQSQRWQTLVNFNTQRRLLLTGTPLQNNLMELWSLLHFLMPHIFRSRKEFSYWFSNPLNSIVEGGSARNDDLIGRLHGIIRPFVLRRLKRDVEKQMPGKYEHIVKCHMSRRQMFLYEEFMARSATRTALKKGGNYMGMMNVLMQLRKVCNHPDLFEPRTVITPFFMEPLNVAVAACVVGATEPVGGEEERLSGRLAHPVWSGPRGTPSFEAVTSHDSIRAEQLARLETNPALIAGRVADEDVTEPRPDKSTPLGLATLLNDIWALAKEEKEATARLHATINSQRCRSAPFAYSERTLDAVRVDPALPPESDVENLAFERIASTPSELLAMRRTQQQRADDLDETIRKFVFCVPRAGARKPRLLVPKVDLASRTNEARLSAALSGPLEATFRPFRTSDARLTSFFPDKNLVQFDAGKLQALAVLTSDLKRGGHRALIFTQMSKMLDILEAFLNLHGYTYLRLDGGTGVEKRQRLMDRFNNDTKVFCFILSTRSGGLGINLTGADTVIFYDSDWNPAMDAQAQDRAHRIGQTRDVHIYRLVTEHSIEENILIKAKQKRHLDFLVMDEGKFHATPTGSKASAREEEVEEPDILTKGGLRGILVVDGSKSEQDDHPKQEHEKSENEEKLSKEQIENAMASLEDEDDVKAMQGAQKEAETAASEALQEFDESAQCKENGDEADSQEEQKPTDRQSGAEFKTSKKKTPRPPKAEKEGGNADTRDDIMEKEFAAWQNKVGVDTAAINASLTPMEKYALHFREEKDPQSTYSLSEQQRMQEVASMEEEWDMEDIEKTKIEEETRCIEEGDLLATQPPPETLPRQRQLYSREKSRLRANKLRRKLTGDNWETRIDASSNFPFWLNTDTGEARWEKPYVLLGLEADALAHENRWNATPMKPLVHVMEYLVPFRDRMRCSAVCRQWRSAATDASFVKHVFPVEMGALALDPDKLDHNHFRTIAEALDDALPGDTIELGDGHYWVNDPGLHIEVPLRLIGDENDPSHVVIELSGSIEFNGTRGWMEGVTLRRPRIVSDTKQSCENLRILNGSKFDMAHCVLDNEGNLGHVSLVAGFAKGRWEDVEIKGSYQQGCGVSIENNGSLELVQCRVINNLGDGVRCENSSKVMLQDCRIEQNAGFGISLLNQSHCRVRATSLASNEHGDRCLEGGSTFCAMAESSDGKKQ